MSQQKDPEKILLIKLRKLGDVINTTPALHALRKRYPKAEITYLTEPLGAKVFEFSDEVDQLWIIPRSPTSTEYLKLCYRVYRYKFDIVIDFYQHNKTRLITFFSRAKLRFGFSNNDKPAKITVYNRTTQLTTDDYNNVYGPIHNLWLIKPLGLNTEDHHVSLKIDRETTEFGLSFAQKYNINKKTIAFCAHSERSEAQVPPELLSKIGDFLISKGYQLYFVLGPNERKLAEPVYSIIEDKASCIINYPIPTIAQVRAIFEHCAMYIGNDGGNKHLAVAAGIPTIGIFWGDAPKVWTPPDSVHHRYLQTKDNPDAFNEFLHIFELCSPASSQFSALKNNPK